MDTVERGREGRGRYHPRHVQCTWSLPFETNTAQLSASQRIERLPTEFVVVRRLTMDLVDELDNVQLPWLEAFKDFLLCIRIHALHYFNESVRRHNREGPILSGEEIDEACQKYLTAFETHVPTETSWDYLGSI